MKRARRAVWLLHRWLGLIVGLYLAVIAATGSVLVFRAQIENTARKPIATSAPMDPTLRSGFNAWGRPLETVRGTLFARYGSPAADSFSTIELPSSADGLYTTTGKLKDQSISVAIDPMVQEIYPMPVQAGILDRVEDLHTNLLYGAQGFAVNGWAALAAATLLLSGLILYYGALSPRPPSLPVASLLPGKGVPVVTVRSLWRKMSPTLDSPFPGRSEATGREGGRGDRALIATFHAFLGIATLLLLLVNTLTGAALIFNDPLKHAVYRLTGTPPHPGAAIAAGKPSTEGVPTLDLLLNIARAVAPKADALFVTLPTHPHQAFYCLLRQPYGILPYISVYLDPATGAVLRVDRDDRAPAGRRIMGSIPALHEGTWGGLPVKILYSAVGLAPLALYLSGGWLALRRFRARRQRPVPLLQAVQ